MMIMSVFDAARGMVVYEHMNSLARGVQRVVSDHAEEAVTILRVKDRFTNPANGWSDIFFNLEFIDRTGEHNLTIAEVQLVHKKMLVLREDLGGRHSYERYRFAKDLLLGKGLITANRHNQVRGSQASSVGVVRTSITSIPEPPDLHNEDA